MSRYTLFALLAVLSVAFSLPAHAYLDPASGSMLLQMIVGGVAGLALAVKLFWHRILGFFGGNICFDLFLVGVIIGERRVNLGQGHVADPIDDFLRDEAQLVPDRNAMNGDTRSGQARPSIPDSRILLDQGCDGCRGRHEGLRHEA